ncbi:MAG TPA: TolC family protein [Candidatus Acidoferrum sp.]|jgi:outer membrane protein|nr:TolC family protein [Candidatus Acidoferrum sp.]
MLRITTERKRGRTVLSVEGRLAGAWVGTLEQCWRERAPEEKFSVDLCGVSFIDAAGKVLLKEIHQQGGKLIAEGCLNQSIVEEIEGRDRTGKTGCWGRKKGSHIIFYVAFFSLIVTPVVARGQGNGKQNALPGTAPTGVMRLTLDQAVSLALKQNPTAQIAIITAAESVQDKNVARAALLPQANLSVTDTVERINVEAFFGKKFPGIPEHAGPFQIFSAGPTFSAPVFDLTLFRRYQAARETANASRSDSLSTREQVILLVVSQYIGTLRAVANVQASQSRVELAQALYDQAADVQKEGVGTGIDTLRANVELQNEKQRLLEAEADRETSLFGLSRLLNLDPRQTIELGDSLSFFDTPQPEVAASIDSALAERQEWKALEQQLKAAGLQKKASAESRLPKVDFTGNWAYLGGSSTTGIPTYNYEAAVSVPLFTGGRIHAEIVRADLEIQKLQQQEDDLRNQIALDVKTALINLDSARNQVGVANLGVQLSKEEVDQARDRFKAGVANNIEVIQAQDSLARANDNQIAALYRFNQARADFARSIGQMEKVYSK